MGLRINDDDIFIIYGYGDHDNNVVFLRIDHEGAYKWGKHRVIASEFTQKEANDMIADADKKGRKTFAIRVL